MKYLILILALVGLVACSSTPDGETAENLLKSGSASSSSAKTGDIDTTVAGSQMGDATSETVNAKATRTSSNSAGAWRQHAFDFAGTVQKTGEAYVAMVEADPVVGSIRAALNDPNLTPEQRTDLLDRLQAHLDGLRASLRSAGGDMSALTSLTVTNTAINTGNAGHEQKSLTPEEAGAAERTIPAAIREAKGSGE